MRIYLVQPDDARARELSEECAELGFHLVRVAAGDAESVRALGEVPPDAVLVCLEGAPDAALDLARALASRRRLRGVPLVFAGGTQDALSRAQASWPKASFARMDVLLNVLSSLRS